MIRNRPGKPELRSIAVLAALLLSTALSSTSAVAQEARRSASGAIDYVSGGVGKDEADAMKRASADYPLTVELAATDSTARDGEPKSYFISGASVKIRDAAGNQVVTATTDGPFLLAHLPDGTYTVDAEWNGVRKSTTVTVDGRARRHVMFNYTAE